MSDTIFVSPFHDIPPNSTDLEYEPRGIGESNTGGDLGDIEVVGPPPGGLQPPMQLRIKSYKQRTASDGTIVVDVTFECEDIEGATGYDIRTTKI